MCDDPKVGDCFKDLYGNVYSYINITSVKKSGEWFAKYIAVPPEGGITHVVEDVIFYREWMPGMVAISRQEFDNACLIFNV